MMATTTTTISVNVLKMNKKIIIVYIYYVAIYFNGIEFLRVYSNCMFSKNVKGSLVDLFNIGL